VGTDEAGYDRTCWVSFPRHAAHDIALTQTQATYTQQHIARK